MKIKVSIIGVPEMPEPVEVSLSEPHNKVIVLLDYLERNFKPLYPRPGHQQFCLLINGRNVLSLPEKLLTKLQDGDEVILTIPVMGG